MTISQDGTKVQMCKNVQSERMLSLSRGQILASPYCLGSILDLTRAKHCSVFKSAQCFLR